MKYYIVPENVVNANQGRIENGYGLSFRKDNLNRWVVNIEVAANWVDIDWQSFEEVELTLNDFPTDII